MDGILLLNKPKNMTSHDCVNKIRKIFNTKKVGHLGTLDPDVTGVLPLCINNATKIIQFLDKSSKEYLATISIGSSTTTEDSSGRIVERDETDKEITRENVINVLESFLGKQIQIPPMISAVKVNGKKLYEYARENLEVLRPKREIEIFNIELLSEARVFSGVDIELLIKVHCSKGTYIRTLAVDIGKRLGYPAHLKELIRLKSGSFSLNDCFTFTDIENGNYNLISIFDALCDYPRIEVNDNLKEKILNGQKLLFKHDKPTQIVFYDRYKQVLAIYKTYEKSPNMIKPVRVLKSE